MKTRLVGAVLFHAGGRTDMTKLIVAFRNFAKAHKNCNVLNTILNIKASILGGFAKLRKSTISTVMSVRPSAWNNSAPTGRILMKFGV
jgi:hypothetical protein